MRGKVSKQPKIPAAQLGAFGERVARERAARRRAAKERAAHDAAAQSSSRDEDKPGEPEIVEIPQSDLANELSVLAAIVAGGLARHHTEAKRLFKEEGISVNGAAVLSDKAKLTLGDVSADGLITLALGKKRQVLLRPV